MPRAIIDCRLRVVEELLSTWKLKSCFQVLTYCLGNRQGGSTMHSSVVGGSKNKKKGTNEETH